MKPAYGTITSIRAIKLSQIHEELGKGLSFQEEMIMARYETEEEYERIGSATMGHFATKKRRKDDN
jgi:hypothetical protein